VKQNKWEVIDPGGKVQVETVSSNPLPENLDGKTVLLKWNSKHNGDLFLNRIGTLLTENFKEVNIIKAWEVFPETNISESRTQQSLDFVKKLSALKPDISIGAYGD